MKKKSPAKLVNKKEKQPQIYNSLFQQNNIPQKLQFIYHNLPYNENKQASPMNIQIKK